MATKMQQRRGTAAEWSAANETVPTGAIAIEEDTGKFKLGKDLPWNDTGYAAIPPSLIDAVGDLIVGSADNVPARLAKGTTGQRLAVDASGILTWVDDAFLSKITAPGDLVVGTAAGTAARLALAGNGKVLGVVGGALQWVTPSADVPLATVTAAGDLIVATGNAAVGRLGKGSNNQVLAVVGGAVVWADLPADPVLSTVTTAGDMIVATGAGAIGRLARGSSGQVLTVSGSAIGWVNQYAVIAAAGDLIVGTGVGTAGVLSVGSNGKVLGIVAGAPAWITITGWFVCTSTTRPAHAAGLAIYETDTNVPYISTGAAWQRIITDANPGAFLMTGTSNVNRKIMSGLISSPFSGVGTNPAVQTITFPATFNNSPVVMYCPSYILGSVDAVAIDGRPNGTPLTKADFRGFNITTSYTGNLDVRYIATDA